MRSYLPLASLAACASSSPPSPCELRAVGVCAAVEDCVGWVDADFKSCVNLALDECPTSTTQESAEGCTGDAQVTLCDLLIVDELPVSCGAQVSQ